MRRQGVDPPVSKSPQNHPPDPPSGTPSSCLSLAHKSPFSTPDRLIVQTKSLPCEFRDRWNGFLVRTEASWAGGHAQSMTLCPAVQAQTQKKQAHPPMSIIIWQL